jgi:hypothetical protein
LISLPHLPSGLKAGTAAFAFRAQGRHSSSSTAPQSQCAARGASGIAAQQTDIFSFVVTQGEDMFMWIGDRWQQSPDGIKSHDPTYWGLLSFTGNGSIVPMSFTNEFQVDVLP